MPRVITAKEAIGEATVQAMERDPSVFLMGVNIDDPKGIFGTTLAPYKKFGPARAFDTPISENMLTGAAVGAAIAGMRPLMVHARMDFLLLTMDQIVNHAAKWRYMSGGRLSAPIVIRAVVGKGWGQAAQHSQSLQALFAHAPGLSVVMPANAYDAKGLLAEALSADGPVIFIEHRSLHEQSAEVPEAWYRIPFGQAAVRRPGTDVTIVAVSMMVAEAEKAAAALAERGISAEVIDLRTVKPWDKETVLASVKKTGRLLIADTSWKSFGISAEISATVSEEAFSHLKAPVRRVALPDAPTPCSPALEKVFYADAKTVETESLKLLDLSVEASAKVDRMSTEHVATPAGIRGPF